MKELDLVLKKIDETKRKKTKKKLKRKNLDETKKNSPAEEVEKDEKGVGASDRLSDPHLDAPVRAANSMRASSSLSPSWFFVLFPAITLVVLS